MTTNTVEPWIFFMVFTPCSFVEITESKSPDKLQSKLYLAGGCDRGRLQRGIGWNGYPLAVECLQPPGAKVGPVEQIEELSPELDLQFLARQIVVLEERKIKVLHTRGTHRV